VVELATARGWVRFCDRGGVARELGVAAAHQPVKARCLLATPEVRATQALLERNGLEVRSLGKARIAVEGPAAVGGQFVFGAA
jgi:hypothetical protein